MNLKTDEIKITFGDGSPPLTVNGREAGLIRCWLLGQTPKGIRLRDLLPDDRPMRALFHLGLQPDDVVCEVSVVARANGNSKC